MSGRTDTPAADFPMTLNLRAKGAWTLERWIAECKARGYRVLVAYDESHCIAEKSAGRP